MRLTRLLLPIPALGALTLGGACGGGGDSDERSGPTARPGEITFTAKDFSFAPKAIEIQAGKPAAIVLDNIGHIEHDITIDDPAVKITAASKTTVKGQLEIATPGTYTFYCSVVGHRIQGMEGTVTVS